MKPKRLLKSETNRLTIRRNKFVKSHQQTARPGRHNPGAKLSVLDDGEVPTRMKCSTQEAHTCAGCNERIHDRFLLSACNKFWHDNCLKCDRCQAKLGELGSTLYEKGNMNLCRQDYFEMFGRKSICSVCDKLIYASEMVMRAKQNVYHLECFACQLCGLRFCVGDRFHLFENKIVCQYDYDEHILPMEQSMRQQHLELTLDSHASDSKLISVHVHEDAMISCDSATEPMAAGVEERLEEESKADALIQEREQLVDSDSTSVVKESKD